MKRLITGIAVLILVLSLGMTEVFGASFACGARGNGICRKTGEHCGQTYPENRFSKSCHLDVNGDGVCDFSGNNGGFGFTDTNDDGICDNRSNAYGGKGCGVKHGGGHRRGCK